MILRPFAPVTATAIACAAVWIGWRELDLLRGTLVWDLRYVLGGAAAILALCAAEWLGRDPVSHDRDDHSQDDR